MDICNVMNFDLLINSINTDLEEFARDFQLYRKKRYSLNRFPSRFNLFVKVNQGFAISQGGRNEIHYFLLSKNSKLEYGIGYHYGYNPFVINSTKKCGSTFLQITNSRGVNLLTDESFKYVHHKSSEYYVFSKEVEFSCFKISRCHYKAILKDIHNNLFHLISQK